MSKQYLQILDSAIDRLLKNEKIEACEFSEDLEPISSKLLKLQQAHNELYQYAMELSRGNVDATPPPRNNYLAAGLKQFQAQIRHLTWQAKCIAEGDYKQNIDFMGEFSEAFNRMVAQLSERESNLLTQQKAMEMIFDRIESIIVIDENDNTVLYSNQQATERFSLKVGDDTSQSTVDAVHKIMQLCRDNVNCEIEFEDVSCGKWYNIAKCKIHWSSQTSARLYYCLDITLHKERENSLTLVARTDSLTGINNRRAFDQSFKDLWKLCQQLSKPISIIMFDIDHFKKFNDTYGHVEGDKALITFAKVLGGNVNRSSDVVARYGGEEFVALLPFTDGSSALGVAERIRTALEKTSILVDDKSRIPLNVNITVSGGVATTIPCSETNLSQLIQNADSALYLAKSRSRNRVCYYEPSFTLVK